MGKMLKEIEYVFTKQYKQEVEHYEFKKKLRDRRKVKLKCGNDHEDIDNKIKRLVDIGYKSNCHISVPDFS